MARYALFLFLAMSMANLSTHAAQDEDDYIRIARISYMEGNFSFQHT